VQDNNSIRANQYSFNATHVNIKKLYNWFLIRDHLLSVNTSGLYDIREFKRACRSQNLNYNSVRMQLSFFESDGLLIRNKTRACIKIVELNGIIEKLYKLFKSHQEAIAGSKNPKIYFADLWKERLIRGNVRKQAIKEAEKCIDKNNGNKLMKIVISSKQPIGKKHGVNLSLLTIGRLMGRTKTTAYRTIERMNNAGILRTVKRSLFVCDISDIDHYRKVESLYGRLFVKGGQVRERIQNSYIFKA
jgi:hypothetical protein